MFGFSPLMMGSAGGPEFRSVRTVTNNTQNQSVSAPDGQLAGDLLLLVVSSSVATVTTPTGWTVARSNASSSMYFYVFYKFASSDGESVQVNTSVGFPHTMIYAAYSGVSGVDIGALTTMTSSSTSITISAVTATAPGIRVVASMNASTSRTLSSGPSGLTQIALTESPNANAGLWHKEDEPSGTSATATVTWSVGGTENKAGVQLHLY